MEVYKQSKLSIRFFVKITVLFFLVLREIKAAGVIVPTSRGLSKPGDKPNKSRYLRVAVAEDCGTTARIKSILYTRYLKGVRYVLQ